jgi:hypothetical protein
VLTSYDICIMKNTITTLLLAALSLSAYKSNAQQTTTNQTKTTAMSTEERKYAVQFLTETEAGVYNAVKGLKQDQLWKSV